MLRYLIILLDESSASFCHYKSERKNSSKRNLIPIPVLKEAVIFSLKNNLKINLLYPYYELSKTYNEIINEFDHIKLIPFCMKNVYKNSILIINSDEIVSKSNYKFLHNEVVIFRLKRQHLTKLYSLLKVLVPKCRRINLVLLDIENYNSKDLENYKVQLKKISDNFQELTKIINIPEINFITDRIVLKKMNNCNAGIEHITLAPDGNYYICPAFRNNKIKYPIQIINNEINIPNNHLFEIKYSPICRICDCFHCKRCVFLNKLLTNEINTPSSQQCISSHLERNSSRSILIDLKNKNNKFDNYEDIPEIEYLDPFVVVEKQKIELSEFKTI